MKLKLFRSEGANRVVDGKTIGCFYVVFKGPEGRNTVVMSTHDTLESADREADRLNVAGLPVVPVSCGCCARGCVCHNHQDASRGLPVRTCEFHLAGRGS